MTAGHYGVFRRAADRLEIEFGGDLSEQLLLACDGEAGALSSIAKPRSIHVLIDLQRVDGYSLEARDALLSLQRHLGRAAIQTAYVTASSAGRSLALWATHLTSGQDIKTFANREAAVSWLGGTVGPATGMRPIVRAGDREVPRKRRRSAFG